MINLMPYEDQKQTRAARANVILIRYVLVMLSAIAFLVVGCGVTYITIMSVQESSKPITKQTSVSQQTATSQNDADILRVNLQAASSVFSQRVAYGDILTSLASVLPAGAAIDSISLDDASFGSKANITIKIKSPDIEPRLNAAFNSPYFSGYEKKLQTPNPDGSSDYKFILTVSLTFNKVTNQ